MLKNGLDTGHYPPLPYDIIESKQWTLSLSSPVTLGGSATLRRQSYEPREQWRIIKNLFMLGASFALLFTAFMAMANLQSSIHSEAHLGVYSLASIYGSFLVSSLFVPSFLLARLKTKGTLLFSITGYVIYMAAQFYPRFETLIPASLLIGFCASGLWTSQSNYVMKISEEFAFIKNIKADVVAQWFFGFFFLCFHSSQIWGNLISSFVLSGQLLAYGGDDDMKEKHVLNLTLSNTTSNLAHCGAHFCPARVNDLGNVTENEHAVPEAQTLQMQVLIGIFVGCSIVAALVVYLGVDSLTRYGENEGKIIHEKWNSLLIATVKHWKKPKQLLLIPLALWLGIQEAFIGAEFTVSFVTCGWGIHQIGFVMTAFGICAATSSLIVGKAAEYVGRPVTFATAAICNVASFVTMLNWRPTSDEAYNFFIIAGLWGIGDGVWSPQVRSIYGIIFKDTREAGFSNVGLWLSIGFIIVYMNAAMLCMTLKIYIYLGILALTMIGYSIAEYQIIKEK